MRKPAVTIVTLWAGSLGTVIAILSPSTAPGAVLNLGPEQIVLAGGGDLSVPGYSSPCFTDFNNDGLKDILVGEGGSGFDGKIRVYLNNGSTTAPHFSDFGYARSAGIDLVVPAGGCMGAFPRIAHFDADDKKDLLVGRTDGTVQLFRNVGTDSNPTFDGGALLEVGPAGFKFPIDVGNRATIALTDWDNNGARDLVLGALDGNIHLYLNQGTTTEPDFLGETIVQNLAGDLQVPSGRSSPVLMDLDGDGRKDLLVGNTNGAILLYTNQGSDSTPSFSTYDYVAADGVENALQDLSALLGSRPTRLRKDLKHGGQDLAAEQTPVIDGVPCDQPGSGLPAPHLVEEKVAQTIDDDAPPAGIAPTICLPRLWHVTLHACHHVSARLSQLAELVDLLARRKWVVGLQVLELGEHQVRLILQVSHERLDAIAFIVKVAVPGRCIGRPGLLGSPDDGGNERQCVAVVLQGKRNASQLQVVAAPVGVDPTIPIERQRLRGSLQAKVVHVVAAQPDDVGAYRL